MRYHRERAKSIAKLSGFAEVAYTCEHYADEILKERALFRRYRARVLLCDRALTRLETDDRALLRSHYLEKKSPTEFLRAKKYSRRTYYRRLDAAEKNFLHAVDHLVQMRKLTAPTIFLPFAAERESVQS